MDNEYRISTVPSTQGIYIHAKNLEEATKIAMKLAKQKNEVGTVQLWRPTRGKLRLVKHGVWKNMDINQLIRFYAERDFDVSNVKRMM